jgi:REP element-mobilizing transposase RayT
MSTGYQIDDQQLLYFVTFQVVDWVDIFTRQIYRDIVIESLRYCQKYKDLQIFGYVIMSNHIHLILQSPTGKLSDTIRDFKKFTSSNIIKNINENACESRKGWILSRFHLTAQKQNKNDKYKFWTSDNHAEVIYSESFAREKLDYIHNNPVKAGIVKRPQDYIYSSASNYADEESILKISLLSLKWRTIK